MVAASECLIIAEAGVNHNGSEDLALQLVAAAEEAGADAIKFQTFRAETLVRPGTETADYQKDQTGHGDQFDLLKGLELPLELHFKLKERAESLGLEFLSTPFEEASADFLVELGVRRLKVPSGELTNLPFIAHLASKNLPMLLSTGMATLEEVTEAVEAIRFTREQAGFHEPLRDRLTLLHCTSNYPAALEHVNLRAMTTLENEFELPVGYSDHTAGILVAPAAVGMGAVVIEKHFTLDRTLPGPDHAASLEPDDLARMIINIRSVETALGSPVKTPAPSELPVRELVRKSVTLAREVAAGESLKTEDLVLLRPGTGIPPHDLEKVIGRRIKTALPKGHTLDWPDLEP